MSLNEVLKNRRSVRKYDASKKVTKEQVEEMVAAAIEAPSWKNSQTARYYAILEEDKLADFSKECLPEMNAVKIVGASVIVTTFVSNRAGFERDGSLTNELGNGWGCYDLGLHNMNLLLKATELGLGTLVIGIRDAEKIRTMLNIPETETIVSVIAVGYKADEPERPKRKEVADILKFV